MNGEITAKVSNELKIGKREGRTGRQRAVNDGNQDDVTGSRNETKIRGKEKQNNARKERNWKTDLK